MKKSSLQSMITVVFAVVMAASLFCALGYVQVCSTDEAAHGINAYEMSMDHHYIVNTLKHKVDYFNSKPPLMLWLIMLGYRFFGYTPLGMRVPSAAAGLILYLLVLLFCRKKWGTAEMLLFSAFLPACRILFDFHMFRSGDMDAVYTLFFAMAVYSVYKAGERPVAGMLFFGLFGGLAFMTKGPHAAFIAAVGILFYPLIRKKVKFRYLCMSAGVAAAVVLPWAVARYCHDGLALFSALLVGETVERVEDSRFTLLYFKELAKEPICVVYILLALAGMAVYLVNWKKAHQETDRSVVERLWEILKEVPDDIWVLAIWFCVVFGGYFLAKGNLEWYIYSAFIPLGMLGARGGGVYPGMGIVGGCGRVCRL